jgi:hypothetical protein
MGVIARWHLTCGSRLRVRRVRAWRHRAGPRILRAGRLPRRAGERPGRRVSGRTADRYTLPSETLAARAIAGARPRPLSGEAVAIGARTIPLPLVAGKPGARVTRSGAPCALCRLMRLLAVLLSWRRPAGVRVLGRARILRAAIRLAGEARRTVRALRDGMRERGVDKRGPGPLAGSWCTSCHTLVAVLFRASAAARPGPGVGHRLPGPTSRKRSHLTIVSNRATAGTPLGAIASMVLLKRRHPHASPLLKNDIEECDHHHSGQMGVPLLTSAAKRASPPGAPAGRSGPAQTCGGDNPESHAPIVRIPASPPAKGTRRSCPAARPIPAR